MRLDLIYQSKILPIRSPPHSQKYFIHIINSVRKMCQVRTAHFFMNSKNKIVRFKVKYDSFIVFIKTGASSLKKKTKNTLDNIRFQSINLQCGTVLMWQLLYNLY